MSAPLNTAPVSRIGKGRLPDSVSADPGSCPVLPATAITPAAVKTVSVADQAIMVSSQNLNITSTPAVMTPDPASKDQHQAATHTSKWGKSSASEGGPVFQVVSRNTRIPAETPSSYTPPSPPTKTRATAPRTRSVAPSRSSASSSSSIASVSLRRSTSGTSSNGSPMAFGSRADRPTGRLVTDCPKGNPTPPLTGNCKSLVRMLCFDEAAQSPGVPAAGERSDLANTTASAVLPAGDGPTAPAEILSSIPAGPTAADAGAGGHSSTLATAPNPQHNRISRTWLPGDRCSSPLQDPECNGLGRPTAAALRVGFGPLPEVHDAVTATTAAQLLLQQLLDSASSITAAAGLSADSLSVAALSAGSLNADGSSFSQQGSTEGPPSACDSTASIDNWSGFEVLTGKAAVMLEAGCRADDVRQAVLPALLLQLAGMACNHNNSNSSFSSDPLSSAAAGRDLEAAARSDTGAAAAAAAALKAGVKAGVVAAKTAMSPSELSAGTVTTAVMAAPAASMSVAARRRGGLGRRVVGACLVLFSGLALLATGFVVAIAWTVLEGGSAWVNNSKDIGTASGIGHDGVDWPVEWLLNGRVGSDVWGGAVLAGRRFAA